MFGVLRFKERHPTIFCLFVGGLISAIFVVLILSGTVFFIEKIAIPLQKLFGGVYYIDREKNENFTELIDSACEKEKQNSNKSNKDCGSDNKK